MNYTKTVLILTPIKDAEIHCFDYFRRIGNLSYPAQLTSLAFLESDSSDLTYTAFREQLDINRTRFVRANIWQRDFGFRPPPDIPRWDTRIQLERRAVLARSRNHLLFRALEAEDYVLWLDVDVIEFPNDTIERLIAVEKDIIQPNCVQSYGGRSYDLNAWQAPGLHLHDLRGPSSVVPLDAVGGTVLLVRADCHRDGLVFPPFLYGSRNAKIRRRGDLLLPEREGEIETEGLGILAADMGFSCWGMPDFEVLHSRF